MEKKKLFIATLLVAAAVSNSKDFSMIGQVES